MKPLARLNTNRKEKTAGRRKLRLAAVVLIGLLVVLPGLVSCSSPSDAEAIARLKALLPRSLVLEDAVWGEGLPADGSAADASDVSDGDEPQYVPVAKEAPFPSVAAFLAELAQVYTVERAEVLLTVALIGNDESEPRYSEENGVFCVDVTHQGVALGRDIDLTRAVVTGKTPYLIEIAAPVRYADGTEGEKTFTLANVDGEWLLDSPTYYKKDRT